MIPPLTRTETLDLRDEPLPPCWARRAPTPPAFNESPGPGVWRAGPRFALRDALVAALDQAREVALVASFLLADEALADAMRRAADRGVRVYALTASKQRLGKVLGEDDDFDRRMAQEHERLLDGLAGRVLLRSGDHLHAKFVVIDPGPGARGWISTANFNQALRDGLELAVELDLAGAKLLAMTFRWAFWREADQELRAAGRLSAVRPPPTEPTRPPATGPVHATLQGGTALRDATLALIRGARRALLVASYGLDAGHESVAALLEARRRGVEVTVLTRPRKAVAEACAALAAAGARVVAHDRLHAKALVADGVALVMTANLEGQGLDRGFEVGALLAPQTAAVVEQALREWIQASPWEYKGSITRGQHLGEFLLASEGMKGKPRQVVASAAQRLSAVTARDALALEQAPAPRLSPPPPGEALPQRLTFTWEVQAPTLPTDAREKLETIPREEVGKDGKPTRVQEKRPLHPRVFERGRERFVKLERAEDAAAARQLADRLGAVVVI